MKKKLKQTWYSIPTTTTSPFRPLQNSCIQHLNYVHNQVIQPCWYSLIHPQGYSACCSVCLSVSQSISLLNSVMCLSLSSSSLAMMRLFSGRCRWLFGLWLDTYALCTHGDSDSLLTHTIPSPIHGSHVFRYIRYERCIHLLPVIPTED